MLALWPEPAQEAAMTHIEKCGPAYLREWVTLRLALWPDEDQTILEQEASGILADPDRLVLIARDADMVAGFAEAASGATMSMAAKPRPSPSWKAFTSCRTIGAAAWRAR
jgi:hypothetical protein